MKKRQDKINELKDGRKIIDLVFSKQKEVYLTSNYKYLSFYVHFNLFNF